MTRNDCPSKPELLAALRASRDEVLAIVRWQPPEALERGRYEGGWNGRQILAHIASIEWTYPRLLDVAREAGASASTAESGTPTRSMRGGNDAYNERQVAKRAHLSVAELLEEFERNRAAKKGERLLEPSHFGEQRSLHEIDVRRVRVLRHRTLHERLTPGPIPCWQD